MSVRAAAQVVLDDLQDARKRGQVKDEVDAVSDAIETLREGLIDDRAREAGPAFYKTVTQLLDTGLPTAPWPRGFSDAQVRLLSRLRGMLHEVKHGAPE